MADKIHIEAFLKSVAGYYAGRENVERTCFIFPNRRSMVFFRSYLAAALKACGRTVLKLPDMTTINDFFYRLSGENVTERTILLVELYDCYRKVYSEVNKTRVVESLDDFIFWGDTILADFNDVDKYLIDAEQLFFNISDLGDIQSGWIGALSEKQRRAVLDFLNCFTKNPREEDAREKKLGVKDNFLSVWNMLYPVYKEYNAYLKAAGHSYEGMVYRALAEELKSGAEVVDMLEKEYGDEKYVFVGLNALNACEKTLLTAVKNAGMAEFAWDYFGHMIQDKFNKSSLFMNENIADYPENDDVPWKDEGSVVFPEINVVAVPSAVGQAKLLVSIFNCLQPGKEIKDEKTFDNWINTAIVLPDESMLASVLNSIPQRVSDINVTMGIPMGESEFFSLMDQLCRLQLKQSTGKDGRFFYHKPVWEIFANGLFVAAASEAEKLKMRQIKESARLYLSQEDVAGCSQNEDFRLFNALFRFLDINLSRTAVPCMDDLDVFSGYLLDFIKILADRLTAASGMGLQIEYARAYYCALVQLREQFFRMNENRCEGDRLLVSVATYASILKQITRGITVPFRGEPLKGLQIMGPLETRALDFDNLILMSASEGVFPRKNFSASFIPADLRVAYGMPTYEYQDAVWAYYFYRMISRARHVWILYDARTEGLQSGEESRYVKQLKYHFECPLKYPSIAYPNIRPIGREAIVKPANVEAIVKSRNLSATHIKNYLKCPAKFYYAFIEKLKVDEELEENLTALSFGNVYHPVMQEVYTLPKGRKVDVQYIERWLESEKNEGKITAIVRDKIKEVLKTVDIKGRNIIDERIVTEYVKKTLQRDRELLNSIGRNEFKILGLETGVKFELEAGSSAVPQGFIGFIDRLDTLTDDADFRVVDYKTGTVDDNDWGIDDENADARSALVFENGKHAPLVTFQFYIYDIAIREGWRCDRNGNILGRFVENKNADVTNSIYSTVNLMKKMPENEALSEVFYKNVKEGLVKILNEIYNIDGAHPEFERTGDSETCRNCDFKKLCIR